MDSWMVSAYTGATDKDLWLHPLEGFTILLIW